MIIGITHDQDGRVVQRLSVSTKVFIGLPPNGDRNHPTKLDHFVFLRKKKSANRVAWEADPELTEHYGDECRELHIMLIDDDIENVFPRSYAWWTATERKCWGDGTTATRRTAEKPGGQPWTQCGSGCRSFRVGSANRVAIYASCWRISPAWGASAASTRALTDPFARFTPPCRRSRRSRAVAWPASPPS